MSNDKINHYAKVISEQVASNRISGMRTMEITEAAKKDLHEDKQDETAQ